MAQSDLLPGQSQLNPDAKISHEGRPQGVPLPIVNCFGPRNRTPEGRPQGAPLPIVYCFRPRNRTPEGRPQGAPLPIVNCFRPRNRTPEGRPTRGAPTNCQLFSAKEPNSRRAPTRGAPTMSCSFSGVFFGVGLESGSVAGLGPIRCNRPWICSDMEGPRAGPRSCSAAGRRGLCRAAKLAVLTATAQVWAARAQESVFTSAERRISPFAVCVIMVRHGWSGSVGRHIGSHGNSPPGSEKGQSKTRDGGWSKPASQRG